MKIPMSKLIKIDANNLNKYTEQDEQLLEKSVKEVGVIESITTDAQGEIVTGNARKKVFDKLGLKPKFIKLEKDEYPVIKDDDILDIPIPMVDDKIQQQIAELLEKSFYLCSESKRLLNEAKDMVEKEIEKGL
jgi:hypothetical protein